MNRLWLSTRQRPDREYLARRERLCSEIEQARQLGEVEKLDALSQALKTLSSDRPTHTDLLIILKAEAELCMLKPASLLYPTFLRLQSRFYRFDPERRALWEADLKRLLPNSNTIVEEDVLRQRLRHLTYELNEEAEAYNRLTEERSRVVRHLTIGAIFLLLVLLAIEVVVIRRLPAGPLSFEETLIPGLLAGALGALTSATGSIAEERSARRQEYWWTLQVQLAIRTILGGVYALVVLAAVSSQLIPMTIPKTEALLAFIFVLSFVAGFSDKLFGQTVSQLITGKSNDSTSRGRGRPDRGRGIS
jgi:hypothetical protein